MNLRKELGVDKMYIILFLAWIIFNGAVTTEIVCFGVVIALCVFFFLCKFMDYSISKEIRLMKRAGYFIWYLCVLLREIGKANFGVIRIILNTKEKPKPVMVSFKTDLKSQMARVILANSITLTPGTITVSLKEDVYIIHCLDKRFADGIEESVFVQMLRKMERIGD